jgi:hypothetical protein
MSQSSETSPNSLQVSPIQFPDRVTVELAKSNSSILSKFASVLGLLAAALFFAGWIYRWAYFSFFQLDIITINFPIQSFLMVPIQIFLGSGWSVLLTLVMFVATAFTIYLVILLARKAENWFHDSLLPHLPGHRDLKGETIEVIQSFFNELLIVAIILCILFLVARWRGYTDAIRDAQYDRSTLPVVTLIAPEKNLALGRILAKPFEDPTIAGFRYFGDKALFEEVWRREDSNLATDAEPRVWRLLLDYGGWMYIFPSSKLENKRPSVVAVSRGFGDQIMVLGYETRMAEQKQP